MPIPPAVSNPLTTPRRRAAPGQCSGEDRYLPEVLKLEQAYGRLQRHLMG